MRKPLVNIVNRIFFRFSNQYSALDHSLLKQLYTYTYFDHYQGYLLVEHDTKSIISIDPGDEEAAYYNIKLLEQNTGYKFKYIFQTHGKSNHTYSSQSLSNKFDDLQNYINIIYLLSIREIYAGDVGPETCAFHNKLAQDIVPFSIGDLSVCFFASPGHTLDSQVIAITHVNSTSTKLPVLFTGDTILISSIGKTDNPKQMFNSLQKLRGFPNETLIFPGHKIKKENLLFSKSIDPTNQVIDQKIALMQQNEKETLVPTSMAEERQTNPFLKTNNKQVQKLLKENDQQKCFLKLHQIYGHYFKD